MEGVSFVHGGDQPTSREERPEDGAAVARAQAERWLEDNRGPLKQLAHASLPTLRRMQLEASDLVQQTMLQGYSRLDQFRGHSASEFAVWLRTILRHQLMDAIRQHERAMRCASLDGGLGDELADTGAVTASTAAQRKESVAALMRALAQLPADYREVLLLRHDLQLSFSEIAARMNRTESAVRYLWGRAALKLGQSLKSHAEPTD
jgi:RNA polymerase sigma-70 factor (ECF subfamily)